jgi:hypothetical protein
MECVEYVELQGFLCGIGWSEWKFDLKSLRLGESVEQIKRKAGPTRMGHNHEGPEKGNVQGVGVPPRGGTSNFMSCRVYTVLPFCFPAGKLISVSGCRLSHSRVEVNRECFRCQFDFFECGSVRARTGRLTSVVFSTTALSSSVRP